MGNLRNCLPVVLGGAVLMAMVSPALAKTPAEIQEVARAATVKIEHGNTIGTGVIIHKQGQVYSLITNRHVVCGRSLCNQLPSGREYQLSLPDGRRVQVNAKNIKFLGQDLDLAVIQFSSSRSYPVVKVAALGKLKLNDAVFTAGFPLESRKFTFGEGSAIAVVNRRIQGDGGGYSIVYDAQTLPGMSGGGVFNRDGDLVAIHGQGDRFREGTEIENDSRVGSKIGLNRGIPVRWLVQGLGAIGIIVGQRTPPSAIRVASGQVPEVADEYFISGFNKLIDPGRDITVGKRAALAVFTKAIQLNPKYSYAYFMRAIAYLQVGEFQKSLADSNQAIALKPDYVPAYYNRAILKADKLNDPQGALADYNKAITLDPDYAEAYNNRGLLKANKLNDPQGALADYNKAIALKPDIELIYFNRAILKKNSLKDYQGALADYNQAIALKPDYTDAYSNRGILKYDLNDYQGALADFNKAIQLNPQYINAYAVRGVLKAYDLSDRPGGIADLRQAARLARAQGQTDLLQAILGMLNKLGATE
jgi:Flp pilus assembly protein TadD